MGKGNDFLCPIFEIINHWRTRFLAGEQLGPTSKAFVLDFPGKPLGSVGLTKKAISSFMHKIGTQIGLQNIKNHSFRKGGGTTLFSAGLKRALCMIAMRLSLQTLSHYISLSRHQLGSFTAIMCNWGKSTWLRFIEGKKPTVMRPY